jgi:hypothetical protein
MKKVLLLSVACVALFAVSQFGGIAKAPNYNALDGIMQKYGNEHNVQIVKIGNFMMSLGRIVTDDPESREALKSIHGIQLMDFEDCKPDLKASITGDLKTCLRDSDLLLEAKEDGETVRIYGNQSVDGKSVQDIIIYSSEGSLVCLKGKVNMSDLKVIADKAD